MVTRPREQSVQLEQSILERGGVCTLFPLLEITPLLNTKPLQSLIARLHEFDLAIFISPNAVRFGMEAIKSKGGLPKSVLVATVGLSSAQALHNYGIKNVISPQQRFDSEALLALPELQQVSNKNIVIFRGDSGRELLADTLKSRGAQVEYASCYVRSKPQRDVGELLSAKPDAITISSSEALRNLADMCEPEDKQLLMALPLFASHPRIVAAAQQQGWQHVFTSGPGDADMVSALLVWAQTKKS